MRKTTKRSASQAVSYGEAAGFAAVMVLLWINELFDLPRHLFGAAPTPFNWIESIVESAVVLALGVAVVAFTRSHIRRITYLEGFIPICAYCKKIRIGDDWIPFEEYIGERSDATFSHGYCPTCTAEHFDDDDDG